MSKRKKIVEVLMAIDASGSMSDIADDVRGGFNEYIKGLRDDDGDMIRYRVTVCLFNTRVWTLCTAVKPEDVPRLTTSNYSPQAGTALHDAIGELVTGVKENTADHARHLVIVNTDGRENRSREWTLAGVKKLIAGKDTGRWGFVFLGAGPDAWLQGGEMGFQSAQTVNTGSGTRGTYSGLGVGTRMYAEGQSAQSVTQTAADTSAAFETKDGEARNGE